MRIALAALALAFGLAFLPQQVHNTTAIGGQVTVSAAAIQSAQTPRDVNVDINVNRTGGGRWYASPVWLAIGGLALLVLIVLIVVAMRGGGGTTIIRE